MKRGEENLPSLLTNLPSKVNRWRRWRYHRRGRRGAGERVSQRARAVRVGEERRLCSSCEMARINSAGAGDRAVAPPLIPIPFAVAIAALVVVVEVVRVIVAALVVVIFVIAVVIAVVLMVVDFVDAVLVVTVIVEFVVVLVVVGDVIVIVVVVVVVSLQRSLSRIGHPKVDGLCKSWMQIQLLYILYALC